MDWIFIAWVVVTAIILVTTYVILDFWDFFRQIDF